MIINCYKMVQYIRKKNIVLFFMVIIENDTEEMIPHTKESVAKWFHFATDNKLDSGLVSKVISKNTKCCMTVKMITVIIKDSGRDVA